MEITKLLEENNDLIIEEAFKSMSNLKLKGYTKAGGEKTKQKLNELYKKLIQCAKKKELIPILNYTEKIAKERYSSGFDIFEVQTAINSLEASIWNKIFKLTKPEKLAESLGVVSTILGAAKDNLARTYVSLATKTKVPTLNLQSLFSGSESIADTNS
jgi:hypothetical protein